MRSVSKALAAGLLILGVSPPSRASDRARTDFYNAVSGIKDYCRSSSLRSLPKEIYLSYSNSSFTQWTADEFASAARANERVQAELEAARGAASRESSECLDRIEAASRAMEPWSQAVREHVSASKVVTSPTKTQAPVARKEVPVAKAEKIAPPERPRNQEKIPAQAPLVAPRRAPVPVPMETASVPATPVEKPSPVAKPTPVLAQPAPESAVPKSIPREEPKLQAQTPQLDLTPHAPSSASPEASPAPAAVVKPDSGLEKNERAFAENLKKAFGPSGICDAAKATTDEGEAERALLNAADYLGAPILGTPQHYGVTSALRFGPWTNSPDDQCRELANKLRSQRGALLAQIGAHNDKASAARTAAPRAPASVTKPAGEPVESVKIGNTTMYDGETQAPNANQLGRLTTEEDEDDERAPDASMAKLSRRLSDGDQSAVEKVLRPGEPGSKCNPWTKYRSTVDDPGLLEQVLAQGEVARDAFQDSVDAADWEGRDPNGRACAVNTLHKGLFGIGNYNQNMFGIAAYYKDDAKGRFSDDSNWAEIQFGQSRAKTKSEDPSLVRCFWKDPKTGDLELIVDQAYTYFEGSKRHRVNGSEITQSVPLSKKGHVVQERTHIKARLVNGVLTRITSSVYADSSDFSGVEQKYGSDTIKSDFHPERGMHVKKTVTCDGLRMTRRKDTSVAVRMRRDRREEQSAWGFGVKAEVSGQVLPSRSSH